MYPNQRHLYYNNPYNHEAYVYSTPFQEENYYHGGRQFGGVSTSVCTTRSRSRSTSPPPSFVPPQQVEAYAVDPGGIARCLFSYTYVWLRGFEQFWFYPTFVGRNSVSGYRWTGYRWVYFGIDLRQIQSFTCY